MPVVKNAQTRHRIIDSKIRNPYKPFPSKESLREACEENLFGSESGDHISISTIEKDIKYMKDEYDAPIQYSRQEGGYYYEDASFSLEKIPLTEEEMHALRFAASSLMPYKEVEVFKKFDLAITKIFEELMVGSSAENENHIWFDRNAQAPKGQEYLNPLLRAIEEKMAVQLSYFSWSSGKEKQYKVSPILLREYNHLWYLIGYYIPAGEIRTFELGRILGLSFTQGEPIPNIDFSAEAYFNHAFGITVPAERVVSKVKLELEGFNAQYLTENPLHSTQTSTKKNGMLYLDMEVFITPELKSKILSLGGDVAVLAPESLKIWHAAEIEKMKKKYRI